MAPHGIYPTAPEPAGADGLGEADNWIAVSCRSDAEWESLAAEISEPWANDASLATVAGRLAREDELDAQMARFTQTRGRYELAATLRGQGIPAAVIARPSERIDQDAHTREWGLWPTVEHQLMGEVRVDGLGVHLSEQDWRMQRGAPTLGQHNDEVYGTILGLSANEIADLRAEGVI